MTSHLRGDHGPATVVLWAVHAPSVLIGTEVPFNFRPLPRLTNSAQHSPGGLLGMSPHACEPGPRVTVPAPAPRPSSVDVSSFLPGPFLHSSPFALVTLNFIFLFISYVSFSLFPPSLVFFNFSYFLTFFYFYTFTNLLNFAF